jgi:4-hydroxy-2-oxoheptanedioate aldolase
VSETRLKLKLAAGDVAVGVTVNFAHAGLAEFLGWLGADCVLIDGEHGAINENDVEAIASACELTGCASLLRVIADDPTLQRYMGLGLTGIQFPQAQSAARVREVVDAIKYAPQGRRGLGNSRAGRYGLWSGGFPAMIEAANAASILVVHVEDQAGMDAVDEIAAIPEVDVIVVGEADLSNELGVPGQVDHPSVVSAGDKIIRAATSAGKPVGLRANTAEEAERAIARGARFVISSVTRCLALGATPLLEAAR